jgi:5-methyltetrahydrofolate--homocysteine methyltransferase
MTSNSKPLIIIGESVHASIPKTGRVMKELAGLGPGAYTSPSEPLDHIRGLIESQADDGADYIAVNLDAFGEDQPQVAVDMMREYAKMVRKWGKGVPVCIDSSDDDVLIAGLQEWYDSEEKVGRPLLNSIKVYTMGKMLPLKKDYDFAFVGMLMSESGKSHSIDELYDLARRIFDEVVGTFDFEPGEIFFDSTVFPLAIDMPMEPGQASYTHKTFEAIKKIKSDPAMQGVHFTGGISNCARDLPGRRIGVCRAYVAKAMEYGLDSAIANPAHRLGRVEPDGRLLELVDAYAKMDGSAEGMNSAMMLMAQFCQDCRNPAD